MPELATGAAVALAVVFAVSATAKARSADRLRAFAAALRPLGFVPERLLRPAVLAVTAAEAAVVVGLVWAPFAAPAVATGAFLLATGLLVALTTGVAVAITRGTGASCACFGAAERPLSRRHLVRNLALLAIAVGGLGLADRLPRGAADLPAAGLAGLGGALVALLLIRLDDVVDLFAPTAARS
jgi:hypothetical protein